MNYKPVVIGTVTVPAGLTRDKSYECAAWYTKVALTPGTYPLTALIETYGQYSGVKPELIGTERIAWIVFTIPGVIVADNFQSLYCGTPIGKTYDQHQNAGKPSEWSAQLYGYQVAETLVNGSDSPNGITYQLNDEWIARPHPFTSPLDGRDLMTYEIVRKD